MVETYEELDTEIKNLIPGEVTIEIDCYGAIAIFTNLTTDENNNLVECEY